jgi:hypothetical protein
MVVAFNSFVSRAIALRAPTQSTVSYPPREAFVDAVLRVVVNAVVADTDGTSASTTIKQGKSGGGGGDTRRRRRRVFFSSFDPDVCLMLHLKQPYLPVSERLLAKNDKTKTTNACSLCRCCS